MPSPVPQTEPGQKHGPTSTQGRPRLLHMLTPAPSMTQVSGSGWTFKDAFFVTAAVDHGSNTAWLEK